MKSLKAKVEQHPDRNVPRRIYDIESKASKKKPAEIAEQTLKKIAPDLKIKSDLSQLKFDSVKDSILGKHVLYQQQLQGNPISGAWIRVDIDKEGKVYNIQNDLVPEPILKKASETTMAKDAIAAAELTAEGAKQIVIKASGAPDATLDDIVEVEQTYFPHNGIPVLTWKVIIQVDKPRAEWKMYVDVSTGAIVEKINLLKQVNGQGKVFDPNPVVTLNNTKLEDNSPIPASAYIKVALKELQNTGMLDGPYVTTKATPNRVKRVDKKFLFTRKDKGFKEVMVYFHIDRVQRYIQKLGFTNVLNHPIPVNIAGTTEDNSFYSPVDKSLTFGTGGVDDAEDADIIVHEYGHAIQDNQVPGFGTGKECKAMGEGFGDYLAASFFADSKPALMKPTIGNWDAVFYSGAEPPCLRRLDSNKKYPKDMKGEEHDDGEIWSACLWEIRSALGVKTADTLVIAHHFLLTPRATFEDGANALITADKNLNKGRNEKVIRDVFVRRGILPNSKRKNKRAGIPFEQLSNGANHK
jgi:Zn-dependent metalloprotease